MMKWKVVRNPNRSQSADRSLECLKKCENNNNNNDGEEGKENKAPAKESNRQRASSLVRKTAVLTTECINLRSILGLARQRSETNLSSVGLVPPPEPARRSRSEVRLAPGCQTRSSSPPKGWLRGRKRERESRKSEAGDVASGKTVVAGSQRKKRTAKHPECRTDSSGKGPRKSKSRRKQEDIIEEEDVYVEIGRKEEKSPRPKRAGRKKGQAPRPTEQPARARTPRKNPDRTVRSVQAFQPVEVKAFQPVEVKAFQPVVQPTTVVAEVHEELLYLSMDHRAVGDSEYESLRVPDEPPPEASPDLPLPFHIDTPDYSTLESTHVEVEPESIRFDLIDQYRKHKEDSEESSDVNESKGDEEEVPVVAVVRSSGEESPTPFVVKKSFVLTVAKQEKGFQSLCANKRPEPPPAPPADQISVTFRCSECPPAADDFRGGKRSTSVPPARNPAEGLPAIRGRSRDRKSKERGKKGKGRKKESGFVMPQAVIDELSQVLEKRKPSLDELPSFLHPPSSSSS